MSLTIILIILFTVEIVVVSAIVAGIMLLKRNKQTELVDIYRKRLADYEQKMEAELVELENIGEKLDELFEPIRKTTLQHRKQESELLDKRINFIQAEINALVNKESGDDYWDNLCIRLSELMPSPVVNSEPELTDLPTEAIEPDIVAEDDNDIPVLSQKIRIDKNSPTIAYITLTPLQNEIKRLKRIVGRHFGMLSDMKQAIIENKQDPEKAFKLPKALKELQIVHVQLTRSVKALKEENARITKLLTTENSIAGGANKLKEDAKQKALDSIRQNQPPQAAPRRRSAKG